MKIELGRLTPAQEEQAIIPEVAERAFVDCIEILNKKGKKGFRKISYSIEDYNGREYSLNADNRNPEKSRIIRFKRTNPDAIEEVVLVKQDGQVSVLMFEDWGLGERLSEIEETTEMDYVLGITTQTTNPRFTSFDDFRPYQETLEKIYFHCFHIPSV